MIHLFSKTYIEIDGFLDWHTDRIVISETNGYDLAGPYSAVAFGNLISFGTETGQILGEDKKFKDYIQMFETCYNHNVQTNKKVVIFCDKESYIKVISNFFKIIFANIDNHSAYRILKASFARSILIGDRTALLMNNQVLEAQPTFDEFNSVFSSTIVDTNKVLVFTNKIKSTISVEYLLASYYYNGSCKNELKKTIRSMINRNAEEHLKEAWRVIQANILSEDLQNKLGTKKYTIDNIIEMIDDPSLSALKRTNAWRAAGGIGMAREQMDITDFTDEEIETIKQQLKWFNYFISGINVTIPLYQRVETYIDKVRKLELSDEDLIEILDIEYAYEDDDRFWSLRDRENINIYLIEYLLDLNKKNNKEGIKPYLLR